MSLEVKSSSTFFANGATAVLNCNCTTQGTVNAINWKKDDQNLVMNQVYSISSTSMSSVLTISNFGASQEGYYACSAENNEGIISSPSIRLQKACKLYILSALIILGPFGVRKILIYDLYLIMFLSLFLRHSKLRFIL